TRSSLHGFCGHSKGSGFSAFPRRCFGCVVVFGRGVAAGGASGVALDAGGGSGAGTGAAADAGADGDAPAGGGGGGIGVTTGGVGVGGVTATGSGARGNAGGGGAGRARSQAPTPVMATSAPSAPYTQRRSRLLGGSTPEIPDVDVCSAAGWLPGWVWAPGWLSGWLCGWLRAPG